MLITDVNAAGKLPIPPRNLVAQWVVESWDAVSPDTIIRCAVSTRTTRAVDYDDATRARLELDSIRPDISVAELIGGANGSEIAEQLEDMSDDDIEIGEVDIEDIMADATDEDDDDGSDEES